MLNLDSFNDLTALAYEAAANVDLWQNFTETMVDVFGADSGDFVNEHVEQGTLAVYGSVGIDPHYRDSYEGEIGKSNPWVGTIRNATYPEVSHSECGLLPTSSLVSSTFYNEWLKPQRLRYSIAGVLEREADAVTFIGLMREARRRAFSSRDEKDIGMLISHVKRAASLGRLLERERNRSDDALTILDHFSLPCFLLGPAETVDYHNRAADRLLREFNGLIIATDRKLRVHLARDESEFQRAVRKARSGISPTAESPVSLVKLHRHDARNLLAMVTPLRLPALPSDSQTWRTLVLIVDPERSGANARNVLAQYFDLTPRELDLAVHLVNGGTVDSFAESEAMGIGTARWHVKNILSKTNTKRQAELMGLLAKLISAP